VRHNSRRDRAELLKHVTDIGPVGTMPLHRVLTRHAYASSSRPLPSFFRCRSKISRFLFWSGCTVVQCSANWSSG
jgi:hypothetical protein